MTTLKYGMKIFTLLPKDVDMTRFLYGILRNIFSYIFRYFIRIIIIITFAVR